MPVPVLGTVHKVTAVVRHLSDHDRLRAVCSCGAYVETGRGDGTRDEQINAQLIDHLATLHNHDG